MDLVWDMETQDPDDFLTLLLLLGHPGVNLLGVTVTPGTPEQVGVIRRALDWFDRSIPVGAFDLDHVAVGGCVSGWHHKAFGAMPPSRDALPGPRLLRELCGPDTTLVTGAPLKNLGAALALPGFRLGRLVAQGGFAGVGVVPPDRQLAKFRGLTTCPSYNLNGDRRSALAVFATDAIAEKRFVSKNVCHGVAWDPVLHERAAGLRPASRSVDLMWRGMDTYRRRAGKLLHDPLAACCAIDPSIADWAEVEMYQDHGWGARPAPGSGTFITIGYDHERFVEVLLAH